jgi:hypothetical protein
MVIQPTTIILNGRGDVILDNNGLTCYDDFYVVSHEFSKDFSTLTVNIGKNKSDTNTIEDDYEVKFNIPNKSLNVQTSDYVNVVIRDSLLTNITVLSLNSTDHSMITCFLKKTLNILNTTSKNFSKIIIKGNQVIKALNLYSSDYSCFEGVYINFINSTITSVDNSNIKIISKKGAITSKGFSKNTITGYEHDFYVFKGENSSIDFKN